MKLADMKVTDLEGDHLEHYGILGMKWGVRRYQNEDGTRTAAGKARESSARKKTKADYDSGSKKWKMKEARHLSDDELNRRNSRLQREKQYRDLTEPPIRKETRQAAKKILINTATGAASAAVALKYKAALTAGGAWLAGAAAKAYMGAKVGGAAALWLL